MNLHETYQTLLKRGMPELGHWFTYHDHGDEVGVCPALNGHFIPEPIARDLLTMHALRWWLGLKCIEPTTVAFGSDDEMGIPVKDKCRDDALTREMTIASFAQQSSGWRGEGPVCIMTDVYESDHLDPCTRYRSHDMNDDESNYGVQDVASGTLSTILAATAHLEKK